MILGLIILERESKNLNSLITECTSKNRVFVFIRHSWENKEKKLNPLLFYHLKCERKARIAMCNLNITNADNETTKQLSTNLVDFDIDDL